MFISKSYKFVFGYSYTLSHALLGKVVGHKEAYKISDKSKSEYKLNIWDKEKFGYGELIILAGYYVNWLNQERRKQSGDEKIR